MTNFSLTPLFRQSVGFDRFNDLFEAAMRNDESSSYPPYNIEKLDDRNYRIIMAIAGFTSQDITITAHGNRLTVQGKLKEIPAQTITYLHKGIANRGFERRFSLADYVVVKDAKLSNGLLTIELERQLPETMKPRRIAINGPTPPAEIKRVA